MYDFLLCYIWILFPVYMKKYKYVCCRTSTTKTGKWWKWNKCELKIMQSRTSFSKNNVPFNHMYFKILPLSHQVERHHSKQNVTSRWHLEYVEHGVQKFSNNDSTIIHNRYHMKYMNAGEITIDVYALLYMQHVYRKHFSSLAVLENDVEHTLCKQNQSV